MARTFNYFEYLRDDGTTPVSIKIADDIGDTVGLAFGAPDAGNPPAPRHFRPRVVYLLHPATGRRRAVPVATPAAFFALKDTPGSTVSLFSITEAAVQVWNVVGGRGEGAPVPHLIH